MSNFQARTFLIIIIILFNNGLFAFAFISTHIEFTRHTFVGTTYIIIKTYSRRSEKTYEKKKKSQKCINFENLLFFMIYRLHYALILTHLMRLMGNFIRKIILRENGYGVLVWIFIDGEKCGKVNNLLRCVKRILCSF